MSTASTLSSPVSKIPYDVLTEIFIHCLPPLSSWFDTQQPDVASAPMLLCQVCSCWRTVALSSGILWARLICSLSIYENNTDSDGHKWALLKKDVEFIKWWRQNQGGIAPDIFFSVIELSADTIIEPQELDWDTQDFILQYLATAQCLYLDAFLWDRIRDQMNEGNVYHYPNLHTIRVHNAHSQTESFYKTQLAIGLLQSSSSSPLRRLCIGENTFLSSNVVMPAHWSTITHISVFSASISLELWNSLIRSVPYLQWGVFSITEINWIPIIPTSYTLHHLKTLYVDIWTAHGHVEFPLSTLFTNLYLPGLRTLAITSPADSWRDHRALTELNTVLQSSRHITKLSLGEAFLSFHHPGFNNQPILSRNNIAPIWSHAPDIVHLEFEPDRGRPYKNGTTTKGLEIFTRNILFAENKWLDLNNPACPIRKITLSTYVSLKELDMGFLEGIIRDLESRFPGINFEFVADSTGYKMGCVSEEWGIIN
ncbi:hypothetical protein BDN70DRAFT_993614 [Pholiota conissans]|uniref:F-box domain-containing protein n=1 Tax=Pholiota conissans TaxID=109636 RepID=A0A9P5Z3L5_9AGAR|nr:hypothetical protein BDN70DRAFT_993614 [Pholiota conissans]